MVFSGFHTHTHTQTPIVWLQRQINPSETRKGSNSGSIIYGVARSSFNPHIALWTPKCAYHITSVEAPQVPESGEAIERGC